MEEKKLRKRLVVLYVVTVALVFFVLLFTAAMLYVREMRENQLTNFSTLFQTAADRLQSQAIFEHSWFRQMERANNLSIYVADNGEGTLYNSTDSAELTALFTHARSLAAQDGFDITAAPLYSLRRNSPAYTFAWQGVTYRSALSIMPVQNGYRAMLAVKREEPVWTAWRAAAFLMAYGISLGVLSWIGVRLIERALRPAIESRKRQAAFIAAASHELRSPLAVISANAATIKSMPENTVTAIDAIESESARMSRLIGDMLLLASADAKSWPVMFAPVEVDTMLLRVYEAYAPVAAQRGFSLKLHLPESTLSCVKGDAQRLSQVMGILLDNAIVYNEFAQNKNIEIKAYEEKNDIVIEVTDHGVGITDAQKPYIFERFHRGDRARKDKRHFGLGLAIAYELIALHHGSIALKDTSGGGCTFVVRIP